jgi:hypothetical protein
MLIKSTSSRGTVPAPVEDFFVFAFLLLLLLIKPVYAQDSDIFLLQKNDLTIFFYQGLSSAAEEAVKLYPVIKKDLEETLAWEIDFVPALLLVRDKDTFQRMVDNTIIVAYAVPEKGLMVIDYSRMNIDPFTFESTIKHELCHLLLHENIPSGNLPRWLDEGIAQWVSGGLADILMNRQSVLDEIALSNRYISLKSLDRQFPKDEKQLILAYAESKSVIDYIIHEYGLNGILTLLDYLKNGEEIDSAILKSYSISFDEFERRWYDSIQKRATFIAFLLNNIYEILFFLAALLSVYGFIKVFLKKRAYKDDEDYL